MAVAYQIIVIRTGHSDWLDQLRVSVAQELQSLGLHKMVDVDVADGGSFSHDMPTVFVAFVQDGDTTNIEFISSVTAAARSGLILIPVTDNLQTFTGTAPPALLSLNAFEWSTCNSAAALARSLLEELGIEERSRRVFISHRRSDGLGAAEQLHDALTHIKFTPFIDRFAIPFGDEVQVRIADELERHAFLLLLETPEAHLSDWVFDEVEYALSHSMGTLVLQWPGNPTPLPGSVGIPRLELTDTDLVLDAHGYQVLTPDACDRVLQAVELAHANGLARRRRMLISSVREAALETGASCSLLKGWSLDINGPSGRCLVSVTARLPTSTDLHNLDDLRSAIDPTAKAVLVHAARRLRQPRRDHLNWVTDSRSLEFIPENAVGGYW